jgi:PrcB C-terminal
MTAIADDARNIDFRTLDQGNESSGSAHPGLWTARTEDRWQWHWRQLTAGSGDVGDAPAVDWAKEMIIILSLGFRATGGYGIRIERLVAHGNVLDIHAREVRAGPNFATTQAITHPYHVVACARSDHSLRLIQSIDVVGG